MDIHKLEPGKHYDCADIRGERRIRTSKYRCVHCGEVVERESIKKWRNSYCSKTGRNVRLQLINEGQ